MPLGPDNDPVFERVCDVRDVVRLRDQGLTWAEIARELGLDGAQTAETAYNLWQQAQSQQ